MESSRKGVRMSRVRSNFIDRSEIMVLTMEVSLMTLEVSNPTLFSGFSNHVTSLRSIPARFSAIDVSFVHQNDISRYSHG